MRVVLGRPRVWRAVQFGAVSAGSMALTQVLLLWLQVAGLRGGAANATAVTLAAVPAFVVSRRWVWRVRGRAERARQALLFWQTALAGLVLSTALVAALVPARAPLLHANVVNLSAFACIWVAKYLFLDTVVFRGVRRPDMLPGGAGGD